MHCGQRRASRANTRRSNSAQMKCEMGSGRGGGDCWEPGRPGRLEAPGGLLEGLRPGSGREHGTRLGGALSAEQSHPAGRPKQRRTVGPGSARGARAGRPRHSGAAPTASGEWIDGRRRRVTRDDPIPGVCRPPCRPPPFNEPLSLTVLRPLCRRRPKSAPPSRPRPPLASHYLARRKSEFSTGFSGLRSLSRSPE